MSIEQFEDLRLFITGPTMLRPEIRQAGCLPEFGHRDKENLKRFVPMFENLRAIAQVSDEYQPALINGSGSTAMEAAVRSLVADNESFLMVSVGAFGDFFHKLGLSNGKKAELLKFEPGRTIDLNLMEDKLRTLRPAVVGLTHNETSTGVVNDIQAACGLARSYGALTMVDGVSIFGGAPSEIAKARPTLYVTSTQKSLGLPAGFGIVFISPDAREKAARVANRGYTSDILAHYDIALKHQTLSTPNTTLANQMSLQLDYIVNQEGVTQRFERHQKMRYQTRAWVESMEGLELFAQQGSRSSTLTAVKPLHLNFAGLKAVKEAMRERGYLFDPGYGKLNLWLEAQGLRPIFRIGHMGDITPDMLETYLGELAEVLERVE